MQQLFNGKMHRGTRGPILTKKRQTQRLFFHSRGEEVAAGMEVGVRELGNILVRERDMLVRYRNPLRGRTASLPSSPHTQRHRSDLTGGEPSEKWCDPGYGEGQENGFGSDKTARLDYTELVSQEDIVKKGGLASGKGRDSAQERGVGGEVRGEVSEGISEAGLRQREALRSKLGHLIFMAPDEDVERFRHTARQWTRGLPNQVSGQTPDRQKPKPLNDDQAPGLESLRIAEGDNKTPVSGSSQMDAVIGASERVKEEVRSTLKSEGPEAMQEAAKPGAKQLDEPRTILQPPSRFPTLQSGAGFSLESKRSEDGVTQPAFNPPFCPSHAAVTPQFTVWQATLSGGINSSGPFEPPSPTTIERESPVVCPTSSSPNLDTIYSGKALNLNPSPSATAHFLDPDSSNPQTSKPQTPNLQTSNPSNYQTQIPICAKCPKPSLPRAQSTPAVLLTDADSPLDDDVIPPVDDITSLGLIGRAFSDRPTPAFSGSVRATSPCSSTSSQTPSRCGRFPVSLLRYFSLSLLLFPVYFFPFFLLFPV
jgi:hypothetical protein